MAAKNCRKKEPHGTASMNLVRDLLAYGRADLKLNFAGSFIKYDKNNETANWLYVSRPFKIESAVTLRSGKLPFKFSWDRKHLERSGAAHRGKGFDTYLFSAEGHGGGNCPVTPALLSSTPARAGYVVIHEGWHSTLRTKKIHMPYELEEATGRAIGCFGIIEFAKKHKRKKLLEQAANQEKDWAAFARFVNKWHKKLSELYSTKKNPSRDKISLLEKASSEALRLSDSMKTYWEKKELLAHLNNAFFLRYYSYTHYYPLVAKVVRKAGTLREAADIFRNLGNEENPEKILKKLARTC